MATLIYTKRFYGKSKTENNSRILRGCCPVFKCFIWKVNERQNRRI